MKNQIKSNWRDKILILIRTLLILSILINFLIIAYAVFKDDIITTAIFKDGIITTNEIFAELFDNLELIFWSFITLVLTFVPGYYIRKHKKLSIPEIIELAIVLFIYAGIFFSVRFDLYYRFFWWDDILHALAGVIIGLVSFIIMYKIAVNYKIKTSSGLIAFFAFTIAVTTGVLWEILEFFSDWAFGTAHQKWNLPDTEIMLGKTYQGSGLRDTMSDLIINGIGAFATSIICAFLYKKEQKSGIMKRKNLSNKTP